MSSVCTVRWEGGQASASLVAASGSLKETSLPQSLCRYNFNKAADSEG